MRQPLMQIRRTARPRTWVATGIVVAVAFAAAACGSGSIGPGCQTSRGWRGAERHLLVPAGIHKIKHVIVIMQENRSFDSYFGTFPGADGIPMKNGADGVRARPGDQRAWRPTSTTPTSTAAGRTRHANATADINGGKMDGFIGQAESGRKGCLDPTDPACTNSATPDVMGYHTESDIPNYWTYAKDFVLQDHMFEPNASWSLPAHLFLVSEWSAYCTQEDNPSSCINALQTRPAERPQNAPAVYGRPGRRTARRTSGAEARGRSQPIYAWTDLTYLLHKTTSAGATTS